MNVDFALMVLAVLTANVLTGMFLYGARALIRNESDYIAYVCLIVPSAVCFFGAIAYL